MTMPQKKSSKDKLSKNDRSILMGKVRSKNTKPEIAVRKLIHAEGYRFRLHRKDLPDSPDLVFFSLKKVVFVHGCFWHRHKDCKKATCPSNRSKFWQAKFETNIIRDRGNIEELKKMGWEALLFGNVRLKTSSC